MLHHIYDARTAGIDLAREGGYHPHPDHPTAEGSGDIADYWWIPSGRQSFDQEKFFQADRSQDPFGNITTTASDGYALCIETARDALPAPQTNVVSAKNDYRVLQPYEVTDPNGNRSHVAFDALGLVVGTAVMGEDAEDNPVGDSLDGFVADLPEEVRDWHIDDPLNLDATHDTDPHNILKNATTRLVYDLHALPRTGQPNVVYTLARETHVSDEHGTPSKIQQRSPIRTASAESRRRKCRQNPTLPIRQHHVGSAQAPQGTTTKGKRFSSMSPSSVTTTTMALSSTG